MFLTIRRYQKPIFLVVSVITIVSFVIFFRPGGRDGGRGSGKADLGSIGDEPVTVDQYRAMAGQVQLSYFLSRGDWPDHDPAAKQQGFNQEREVYQRLFLLQQMKEQNIHISRTQVGQTAGLMLRSMSRDGTPMPLELFAQNVLQPRGLTVKTLNDLIEYELGLRELVGALGLGGRLVTEAEADVLYRREHEEIATEAAFFNATNYLAAVTFTPAQLATFYTNYMANYRVPERRQVSYVKFPVADYFDLADRQLAALTNLSLQLDSTYNQRGGTNHYKNLTPDAARKEIRDEYRHDLALRSARTNAVAFADARMKLEPATVENFAQYAADHGLALATTAPFNKQTGPTELIVPASFAAATFHCTPAAPFVDSPIIAEDAVYVIALKKIIPSEIPSFESIQEGVTADYRISQAARLAREAAVAFAAGLTNGQTFAAQCTATKTTAVKLPAFSLASRSVPELEQYLSLGQIQEVAYGLPAGSHSGFLPTDNGGMILQIISRTPPADATVKSELPGFLRQLRQTRQGEVFNAWFNRVAQTGLRNTPLARPQQKP